MRTQILLSRYSLLRGFAKNCFFQKSQITMEVGGWVQVSLGIFFLVENRPKIALNQYWYWSSKPCAVYTLLKVVGYYDLSVLSMSVMSLKKKKLDGVGGWGELYPIFFLIFWIFLTLQSKFYISFSIYRFNVIPFKSVLNLQMTYIIIAHIYEQWDRWGSLMYHTQSKHA